MSEIRYPVPKLVNWFEIHKNWTDGAYINRYNPK
jgi:hypothetical protein